MPEWFGEEAPQAGHQQPAEQDQGYGDFVSMELSEKFTDRQKLDRDRGNSRPYDAQYDEAFQDDVIPSEGRS